MVVTGKMYLIVLPFVFLAALVGLNQRRRRADFAAGVYDGWAELRFCVRQQQVFLHVRNADGDDPLLSKR